MGKIRWLKNVVCKLLNVSSGKYNMDALVKLSSLFFFLFFPFFLFLLTGVATIMNLPSIPRNNFILFFFLAKAQEIFYHVFYKNLHKLFSCNLNLYKLVPKKLPNSINTKLKNENMSYMSNFNMEFYLFN